MSDKIVIEVPSAETFERLARSQFEMAVCTLVNMLAPIPPARRAPYRDAIARSDYAHCLPAADLMLAKYVDRATATPTGEGER